MQSVDDLVFVMSPDGRYQLISQQVISAFNLRAEESVGKTPEELFGPELGRSFSRNNRQVIESGKPLQLLEWITLPTGLRCYSTLLTPIVDRKGRVEVIIGVGRDVTDLRRTMEERELYGQQMESLFQQRVRSEELVKEIIRESIAIRPLPEFFESILKALGEGLDVSRSYLFEYDQIRQRATNTHEWVAPGIQPLRAGLQDVPASLQPWWTQEMLSGRMILLEETAKCPSPELKEFLTAQGVTALLAIPIFAFGNAFGFIGFDDTRGARQWNEMGVELLSGVARIIAQKIERDRLEQDILGTERLAAIGRLTASLTHEINNPLQAVLLHLEGLEGHVDDEGQRHLKRVVEGFDRIAGIVSGLLEVNRGGKELERVDLNEVVQAAYQLLAHQIDLKGINMRWHRAPALPPLRGDVRKLQQVFLNVLFNALDSMEKQGELTVSTGVEGGWLRVDVQDTGSGISEEALPYIFEPFYTTKEKKGTGLGLFVCHAIVSEHGGKIEVKSKLGQGTTVSVLLPVRST
jgi:signal transduction histidine kinase